MVKQLVAHIKLVKPSIVQTSVTSIRLPVGYSVLYLEESILSCPTTSVLRQENLAVAERVDFTEEQQVALLELT